MNIGGFSYDNPGIAYYPNLIRSNTDAITNPQAFVTLNTITSAISAEDYWDRTGTIISTHTANDTVAVGSGGDLTLGVTSLKNIDKYCTTCGVLAMPVCVDNGDGTGNIGSISVVTKTNATSNTKIVVIPAITNQVFIDQKTNYVYFTEFSGIYNVTSIVPTFDGFSEILVLCVFRDGTELYFQKIGQYATDVVNRIDVASEERYGLVRNSGLICGSTGTNKFTATGGSLSYGSTRLPISLLNTNVSGSFHTYYYNGSAWVEAHNVTTWSSTQFNDIASGLSNITTANRYAFYDIYLIISESSGIYHLVWSQAEYISQTLAETAAKLTFLPDEITANIGCIYVGRCTFQKSAVNFISSLNPFTSNFLISPSTNHSNLSNLGNDDHTQYAKVTGRSNEVITYNGTGGLKRDTWVSTICASPELGLKNAGNVYTGIRLQGYNSGYNSREIVTRQDGLTIDSYNVTIRDSDQALLTSQNGNAYWFYVDAASSTSGYNLNSSYNGTSGSAVTSGPFMFLMACLSSTTGYVKFPVAYAYNASAGVPLYIKTDGSIGGNSSLRRCKDVSVVTKDYSNVIYGLNTRSFKWKKETGDGTDVWVSDPSAEEVPGLIAEEVEEIDSIFCTYKDLANPAGCGDGTVKPSNWELMGVRYDMLITPMIKCIQDQKKLIDTLTLRLNQLETQLINHLNG